MSYQQEISRKHPACMVFLLDQSSSMLGPFGSGDRGSTKAEAVAEKVNDLFRNMIVRCSGGDYVKDHFHIAVIAYGHGVGPALEGPLAGREIVPISELAANPLRIKEREEVVEFSNGETELQRSTVSIWLEPKGDNATPMREAFQYAEGIVSSFISEHGDSFPPLVVNVSDGQPTSGDPRESARRIMDMATSDGNVIVLNAHLSSTPADPMEFPDSDSRLPDDYARMLFEMSSVLPGRLQANARSEGFHVSELSRGFIFNADLTGFVRFIDSGTKAGLELVR
jgi:hypothetical protein